MKKFKGFIISDGQDLRKGFLYDYPIVYYTDVKPGSALILGVNDQISREIIPTLKREDHIQILWEGLV